MPKSTPHSSHRPGRRSSLEQFQQVYLRNVDPIVGYFARRCADPQAVADLTAETFLEAAGEFSDFDPRRTSDRAWLLSIADRAFAQRDERAAREMDSGLPRGRRRQLDQDEIEELTRRIEVERGRADLSVRDRWRQTVSFRGGAGA